MATLLIADHDGATVGTHTRKALTAALALGGPVDVLVAGENLAQAAQDAARLGQIRKVIIADDVRLTAGLAEPLAALIVSLASGYDAIVAPATSEGKNVMPRIAAKLDVMQLSDIVAVLDPQTVKRPIYAGNAIQTVRTRDAVRVVTVRTTAFAAAPDGSGAPVEALAIPELPSLSRVTARDLAVSDRPDLTTARVVISGGRAFGSRENFDTALQPVADRLGAAIGASRAAVDAGYAVNDQQVGPTGKVIAPDLYIACGISGAIQHIAGIKDARVIVAINKDPEAPIFAVADYGLVGDVNTVLKEFEAALDAAG
jgi:electron transfer flavoprotein alpha subunit